MIRTVHIQNFQSHKNTLLHLEPGVNVIVGGSDSGKSAILRAIKWVVYNKPTGDAFRSNWGGDTEITMETWEGDIITRYRNNSGHGYTLNDIPFKAIGTTIPEEIRDVLNMDEVNIQQQMDSPFLLNNTSGEVAEFFNKLADLSTIDVAVRNITSALNSLKRTVENKEDLQKQYEGELKKLTYVHKLDIEVEVLEGMDRRVTSFYQKITGLKKHINTAVELQEKVDALSMELWAEEEVDNLVELIEQKKALFARISELREKAELITAIKLKISRFSLVLTGDRLVGNTLAQFEKYRLLQASKIGLKNLVDSCRKAKAIFAYTKDQVIPMLENEFKANFPDVCPLCDTPIKHDHGKKK